MAMQTYCFVASGRSSNIYFHSFNCTNKILFLQMSVFKHCDGIPWQLISVTAIYKIYCVL
jgi:hypothetical protein